jgi:hypothetical protein
MCPARIATARLVVAGREDRLKTMDPTSRTGGEHDD